MTSEGDQGLKNVAPISEVDQAKRGWKVRVNGLLQEPIGSVQLTQEKMGINVEYGMTPAGFDGLAMEEAGGGGSVMVPFVEIDREIFIGLVEEKRPYAGGIVLNIPRGFLTPGETHFETARRELLEETGYEPAEKRVAPLMGELMNPNSTFFVTDTIDKGVKPYKIAIDRREVKLVVVSETPTDRIYEFDQSVLKPASKMGERVMKARFYHWTRATQLKDMFTVAAVGRIVHEEVFSVVSPKVQNLP